ncbi:RNA polymerase sigma factor [Fuerstiella marisgermanici]|uniref:RNA polymerase sigma factor n=1 Tax=Fuerstiella marisgermanici TaxID=1891926 RepID=A0A1P8WGR4_9PLAN|nr:sigma-70 family RNA polymerase sigma factor [Fuerstiella marisgermanici]APZ93232.1 RNA polymerase sigma factor [Fuerstiella marisgermanici]
MHEIEQQNVEESNFVQRNERLLGAEFLAMKANVNERLGIKVDSRQSKGAAVSDNAVGMTIGQSELHPHTYRIVDSGFRKYKPQTDIDAYAQTLSLADVKWAGSVRKDNVAAKALLNLIQNDVRAVTLKHSGQNRATDSVLDNLPSHVFAAGESGLPRIEEFRGRSCLRTWLCGIARNLAINETAKAANKINVSLNQGESGMLDPVAPEISAASIPPELSALATPLLNAVSDAVKELSPRQRIAFQLVYLVRKPQNEVARLLNCTAAAVSQNLGAARRTVAESTAQAIRKFSEHTNLKETTVQQFVLDFLMHFQLLDQPQTIENQATDPEILRDFVESFLRQYLEND